MKAWKIIRPKKPEFNFYQSWFCFHVRICMVAFSYFASMKIRLPILPFLLAVFFFACNSGEQNIKAENDIDATRDFIRAALDGRFDVARNFMLKDSINLQYLDAVERNYNKMDLTAKSNYLSASITIHLVEPVNDSATIVVYSNTYKNDHDTLKVLQTSNGWLVDLKYLFTHGSDTLYNNLPRSGLLK